VVAGGVDREERGGGGRGIFTSCSFDLPLLPFERGGGKKGRTGKKEEKKGGEEKGKKREGKKREKKKEYDS